MVDPQLNELEEKIREAIRQYEAAARGSRVIGVMIRRSDLDVSVEALVLPPDVPRPGRSTR